MKDDEERASDRTKTKRVALMSKREHVTRIKPPGSVCYMLSGQNDNATGLRMGGSIAR
jgi:hypothetical protein